MAIARALVGEPALIWADEPTGNLDAETAESVLGLLFEMSGSEDRSMVIITHDADIAERADRTVHVRSGLIEVDESMSRRT